MASPITLYYKEEVLEEQEEQEEKEARGYIRNGRSLPVFAEERKSSVVFL